MIPISLINKKYSVGVDIHLLGMLPASGQGHYKPFSGSAFSPQLSCVWSPAGVYMETYV